MKYLGGSGIKRDLRGLVNSNLCVNQQCALTAKKVTCFPRLHGQKHSQQVRGRSLPSTWHLRDWLWSTMSSFGPPEKGGCQLMGTKWGGQGTVANGIQHKPERTGSTQDPKRWPRDHLSAVKKYLNEGYRGDGARFFLEIYRYDKRQWTQAIIWKSLIRD